MRMKLVYFFGDGKAEGSDAMRDRLGGKGAGLAEMSRAGAPVPPGFTITTEACLAYAKTSGRTLFEAVPRLLAPLESSLKRLEHASGRRFGDPANPLLVSVRSGAKFSMPGMMDTILNLGLTRAGVKGLAEQFHSERFAWDTRRRFVQMFGNVVRGIDKREFEELIEQEKKATGAKDDRGLDAAALERLSERFEEVYREKTGSSFPDDPREQLWAAIEAVFGSWSNPRAVTYRKLNKIPDELGTACNVQAMVFGNRGKDSGTGVGFTRDPGSGEKRFYGEYLPEAQGEDVVAGVRTPRPIAELEKEQPQVYRRLREITAKLEKHYRDVQDFEFTFEEGRLYMLQTRTGKRTARAAIRIATDLVAEKLITKEEALLRVSPDALDQLLKPVFSGEGRGGHAVLGKGLPAGPGAATGRICFSADEAVRRAPEGPVLLVRSETNPDDIHGMMAAEGILTATGGMTSHAAVVGRGMGKVCVVGCEAVRFADGKLTMGGRMLAEGDFLSIDGFTGEVLEGSVPTEAPEIFRVLEGKLEPSASELYRAYATFMSWADGARRLGVRANADRPEDARMARLLGAEGVGLCRTEHMFFGEDRIGKMVAMIVASTPERRREALDALFPLQKDDFKAILKEMKGFAVTIRTLDPPLHEFLPHTREEAVERAKSSGLDAGELWAAAQSLREANPMLGHRGCRVGITHPEVTEMQARAILSAAQELGAEGVRARPEIMIPLVGFASELAHQKGVVRKADEEVSGSRPSYLFGTMIEVPRAVWAAGEIAEQAEFFSFGTNDLTQMTLGYSRDDYGKWIGEYLERKILPADPFQTLDVPGVGAAIEQAVRAARAVKPELKIGVCGEHGGDPASIEFFHRIGVDYVSCSPYRVPVARLAAAQAAIKTRKAPMPKAKRLSHAHS
jgi:pyruvate,orthophosphate dikinase